MKVFDETPYPFGFVQFSAGPGKPTATLIVKGRFILAPDGVCQPLPPDFQLPVGGEVRHADDWGNSLRLEADTAPYKPRADCLLVGSAHAPNGRELETLEVSFSVGPMRKVLWIYGDRNWHLSPDGHWHIDKPAPFVSMPLRYEFAHGGVASSFNKHGKGFGDIARFPDGKMPIANIMAHDQAYAGPTEDVPAEGFGPLDPGFRPRADLRGTYDEEWLYKRKPFPPRDFDIASYNAARRDQQIEGFLTGNEEIVLRNLHPERPTIRSRLPGTSIRVALLGLVGENVGFVEPNVHLDTCVVDMEDESVTLLWRARFALDPSGSTQYTHALISEEPVGAPKSKEHYFERLKNLVLEDEAAKAPPPPPPPPSDDDLAKAAEKTNSAIMADVVKTLKDSKADDALIRIAERETDPMKALDAMMTHAKQLVAGLPKPPQ